MKYTIIFLLIFKCSISFGQLLPFDEIINLRQLITPYQFKAYCNGKGFKIIRDTTQDDVLSIDLLKDSFTISGYFKKNESTGFNYSYPVSQSKSMIDSLHEYGYKLVDTKSVGRKSNKTTLKLYANGGALLTLMTFQDVQAIMIMIRNK